MVPENALTVTQDITDLLFENAIGIDVDACNIVLLAKITFDSDHQDNYRVVQFTKKLISKALPKRQDPIVPVSNFCSGTSGAVYTVNLVVERGLSMRGDRRIRWRPRCI